MTNIITDLKNDFERAQALQATVISRATGGPENNYDYALLRKYFMDTPSLSALLPSFIRTCRDMSQIWQHMKKTEGYGPRRELIWKEFEPLLSHLEGKGTAPLDAPITEGLKSYDEEGVHHAWSKALDRRLADPDGAITAARTLIETVCKHILDEQNIEYGKSIDLHDLYKLVSKELNLAPDQHDEIVFKQILKGCSSVVGGLGLLRNKLGDAHGQGKMPVKPSSRHAALAVNMAGTMAVFLIETWRQKFNA